MVILSHSALQEDVEELVLGGDIKMFDIYFFDFMVKVDDRLLFASEVVFIVV